MTYHVARNNQQLGTFTKEEALQRYNAGTILPTDLVWTDGMATWEAASKIFGAPPAPNGGGFAAPPTPPPYSAPPITGVATPLSGYPAFSTVANSEPCPPDNKTLAIVATVLSVLTCSIISLVMGIIAIVMSSQVTTKYNAGDLNGAKSASKTSKLLSWIAIAVLAVALVVGILFVVAGMASNATRHY